MADAPSLDFEILAVGDLNADLVLRGDVEPAFGQKERLVDDAEFTLGSSAGIFACACARLGMATAICGATGDDVIGGFVRRSLAERGVATDGIAVDDRLKTGIGVILSRGADRAILTYPGSISATRLDHVDLSLLPRVRHVHLASYFLLDSLRPSVPELFDRAHHAGATTSLDTNFDPTERWQGGIEDVLSRTDVFLPNETEATAITGESDPRAALTALAERVRTVAVKRGANGALGWQDGRSAEAGSPRVDAADTTGAGDSFDAGFLYGWLRGWPVERSLRLACACGALSTRAAGGTASQPTLREAEEATA